MLEGIIQAVALRRREQEETSPDDLLSSHLPPPDTFQCKVFKNNTLSPDLGPQQVDLDPPPALQKISPGSDSGGFFDSLSSIAKWG